MHVPDWHVSLCVQPSPSLHDVPFVSLLVAHDPEPSQVSGLSHAVSDELPHAVPAVAFGPDWQSPDVGLHDSTPLQTLPSLEHTVGVPGWHDPPPQTSPVVQALPSLHGLVLLAWTHPVPNEHESSVQGLPSSQVEGVPATHAPPLQVSPVVQASPSLHGAPFASPLVWQTPEPLHVSGLSQAESTELPHAVPMGAALPLVHEPDWQLSLTVQALSSLQVVPFASVVCAHESAPAKGSGVAARVVTPVSVPATVPTESRAWPLASLKDQRWTRPVAEASSRLMSAAIWAWVRAAFQIRSSSTRPMNGS